MARRFRDRVRVAPNGHGERTGTAVSGRLGVICDTLPAEMDNGPVERYWVRFERPHGFETFFDWVLGADLRDY